jgi:hypothetical protein
MRNCKNSSIRFAMSTSMCPYEWVQRSFVRNNVSACFIKHVYHNMFRLKSKRSSGVIVYWILNARMHSPNIKMCLYVTLQKMATDFLEIRHLYILLHFGHTSQFGSKIITNDRQTDMLMHISKVNTNQWKMFRTYRSKRYEIQNNGIMTNDLE